ncbi:MAG: Asp-tRNA(Asn)/Glu-tRNA(Gln) amidotransferase subunit GatB [Myxococcales bacterium]|nr:Asp-tRNA(Asn)/Glu-tRNA(Gln) amidotransferase subunit GatB [Myxococcales bacterium]
MKTAYETIIGLEVHAQLKTQSKVFSMCPAKANELPNTLTDVVTLGLPGVLPVLNAQAVRFAVMMGLATHCSIRKVSRFARKHYFYPDLPKGYQISQYDEPLCEHGWIDIDLESGETKRVGITRIHMEEDAGKTIHDADRNESRVDFNRAGVPLIEIVSGPDMRSPDEAVAYLKVLHNILRYLDICDGNMEEGNFRCDANISLRLHGQERFGTKVEIKNINSFRYVHKALVYEQQRQAQFLDDGKTIVQETRLWNSEVNRTESMRSKEDAHDYRYFPDPDLLPLVLTDETLQAIASELPELPDDKRRRFVRDFHLSEYDSAVLTSTPELSRYYDAVLASWGADPKLAANWVSTELLGALAKDGKPIEKTPVSPENLARILHHLSSGSISGKMAKEVFEKVYNEGADPDSVVSTMGGQVSDPEALLAILRDIIANNPAQVEKYRAGKTQLLGFFVGQVMQRTKGKANPTLTNELAIAELNR